MSFPGAPVPLPTAVRDEVVKYFDAELADALIETQEREKCLKECLCLYLAEPPTRSKTFPWKGAANLVIPLIGITVDSIVARIVNTMFGVDPFWRVTALNKDWVEHARPAEDFLDWSRKTEYDWYKTVKTWTIETVQCGTSWIKVPWDIQTYNTYKPNMAGGFDPVKIERRRPNPQHVLDVDIIRQCGVIDERQAEWMAHRFRLTDTQIIQRVNDKMYDLTQKEVEDLLMQKEDVFVNDDIFMSGCCDGGTTVPRLNTFYEIYAKMRMPGAKNMLIHDMVITYHRASKRIVRAIYNPIAWGERIFVKGRFIEVLGRSKGLGIAKQLKYLQEEITTIHQQQVDNATLANTRFFLGKRGRVKDGTRVWPGRFLMVTDPEKDVKAVQMGDIYNSMQALEQSVLSFAERRSGVSDYSLGRESSVIGDRATATGTLAIIQEGNRRFDLNVRDMRDALGDAGRLILQLNQQFRPEGTAYFVQGEEKGELTEQVLNMPQEYIAHKLGVELGASSATINRQVENTNLTAFSAMLMQHMQTGQMAAQVLADPMAPADLKEFLAKSFKGITDTTRRIAQTHDLKDLDVLVPDMNSEGIAYAAAQQAQLAGGQPGPGGTPPNTQLAAGGGIPPGPAGGGQ